MSIEETVCWPKVLEVYILATVEERITDLVEYAIERLYREKDKMRIVKDLAKDLEGLIPTDTICKEITNRLEGYLKSRTIREYLDVKYKKQFRVKNARKQMDTRFKSLSGSPSNQKDKASRNRQEIAAKFINKDIGNDLTTLFPQEPSNLVPQQDKPLQQVRRNSKKINEQLYEELSEYQEIIEQFNHFTTADSIVEFKNHISIKEILEYIRFNGIRTIDEKISIGVQFDKNTGRILFFGLVPSGRK